jgi:hypothetical protein
MRRWAGTNSDTKGVRVHSSGALHQNPHVTFKRSASQTSKRRGDAWTEDAQFSTPHGSPDGKPDQHRLRGGPTTLYSLRYT